MPLRRDTFGVWQREEVVVEVAPATPSPVVVPAAVSGRSGRAQRQPVIKEMMTRLASQPMAETPSEATPQVVIKAQPQCYHQNLFGTWVPITIPRYHFLNEDPNTPPPHPIEEMTFSSFAKSSAESSSAVVGKERAKTVQKQIKGKSSRHAPYVLATKHQTTINGTMAPPTRT